MLADRVAETTTSTGTGAYELGGAVSAQFLSYVAGAGNGAKVVSLAIMGDVWEISLGTVASGTPDTLTRTLIRSSTGSLINWGAGTKLLRIVDAADITRFGAMGEIPTATGTANDHEVAHLPTLRALLPGMHGRYYAPAAAANTGEVTLALDAVAALPLRRAWGDEIGRGVLRAGALVKWYAHSATELRLDEPAAGLVELYRDNITALQASIVYLLPSSFENFEFRIDLLESSAGGTAYLQLSEDGGSTWKNGGGDYGTAVMGHYGPTFFGGLTAAPGFRLLHDFNSAVHQQNVTAHLYAGSAGSPAQLRAFGGGYIDAQTVHGAQTASGYRTGNGRATAARLLMGSGNIAGRISVLGLKT